MHKALQVILGIAICCQIFSVDTDKAALEESQYVKTANTIELTLGALTAALIVYDYALYFSTPLSQIIDDEITTLKSNLSDIKSQVNSTKDGKMSLVELYPNIDRIITALPKAISLFDRIKQYCPKAYNNFDIRKRSFVSIKKNNENSFDISFTISDDISQKLEKANGRLKVCEKYKQETSWLSPTAWYRWLQGNKTKSLQEQLKQEQSI